MSRADIETAVLNMGDVGTVINLVEQQLTEGNIEEADRAATILREIYESRYDALRAICL